MNPLPPKPRRPIDAHPSIPKRSFVRPRRFPWAFLGIVGVVIVAVSGAGFLAHLTRDRSKEERKQRNEQETITKEKAELLSSAKAKGADLALELRCQTYILAFNSAHRSMVANFDTQRHLYELLEFYRLPDGSNSMLVEAVGGSVKQILWRLLARIDKGPEYIDVKFKYVSAERGITTFTHSKGEVTLHWEWCEKEHPWWKYDKQTDCWVYTKPPMSAALPEGAKAWLIDDKP